MALYPRTGLYPRSGLYPGSTPETAVRSTRRVRYETPGWVRSTRRIRYSAGGTVRSTRRVIYHFAGAVRSIRRIRYHVHVHEPRVVSESAATEALRIALGGEDISANIGEGLRFSNSDPGGFEVCEFALPRDLRVTKGEDIRITCGLATAWEGRVAEVDHSLASGGSAAAETRISGEGYGARLRDGDMSMVYVDRDLSAWEEGTEAWLIAYTQTGYSIVSFETRSAANGLPAISTRAQRVEFARPLSAADYDAGAGNLIGSMWLHPERENNPAGAGYGWGAFLNEHPDFPPGTIFNPDPRHVWGPQNFTAPRYWFPPKADRRRYGRMMMSHGGGDVGSTGEYHGIHWRNPAVYGNHGLIGRGSDPVGYYTSDIVGHVVDQHPGVSRGTIETASSFVVPHASYRTPVSHEQIVSDMNAYMAWHWGTWEAASVLSAANPRFDFRAPPTTKTAWAPRRDIDGLGLAERLDALHDRIRVAYQDPSGARQSLTGSVSIPELTAAGISRTLGLEFGLLTSGSAAQMLAVAAALMADPSKRVAGEGSVRGQVETPTGPKPALLLRAGLDRFAIPDLPPREKLLASGDNEFHVKRVETTVGREGPVTQVGLGAGADLLEVLGARIESSTTMLAGGV